MLSTVTGRVRVISYVLPAHNAQATLAHSIASLHDRFEPATADGLRAEVIVVENGSSDDTWKIASDAAARGAGVGPGLDVRAIRSEKGFGAAIRAGVLQTEGDVVVVTGCDLPFGFSDLDAATGAGLGDTAGVFVGSKRHPNSVIDGRPPTRAAMTGAFAVARRLVLASRVRDTQGSLLMSGEIARRLCAATKEDGFLITTEIIEIAHRSDVSISEVPIVLEPSQGPSTVRPIADSVAMLSGLRRVARRAHQLESSGALDAIFDVTAPHG